MSRRCLLTLILLPMSLLIAAALGLGIANR
jgi:hypothetical protein